MNTVIKVYDFFSTPAIIRKVKKKKKNYSLQRGKHILIKTSWIQHKLPLNTFRANFDFTFIIFLALENTSIVKKKKERCNEV